MRKINQLSNIVFLEFLKKFSGDIYIIALPAIAASLNTDRRHVQAMVSFFLIGVAISQLISGPLSDHLGRRNILLNCLLVFIVGAFLCAFSHVLGLLFLGIFIMGLGIGSAPVIGKAIIHDLYHKSGKTALFLVITSAFVVWAPAVAMAIGGNVSHYFGWEFVFFLSGCLGVIGWLITLFNIPQHSKAPLKKASLKIILENYASILKSFSFSISLLGLAFIASGVFTFYTAGYFVFNHTLHIPLNILGYFTFLIVGGNFCGKFLGSYFASHIKTKHALFFSTTLCFLSSVAMFLFAYFHALNVYKLLIPMMFYTVGLGSMMPVARAYLMGLTPKTAGTASGLTGIVIALVASLVTYIISHFHIETGLPMATLLVITSLIAWLLFLLSYRAK